MFDAALIFDWSARSQPSPRRPVKDAIFSCYATPSNVDHPIYHRTRSAALNYAYSVMDQAIAMQHTLFLGFDFAFGWPMGFAPDLTGGRDPRAVWRWLCDRVIDDDANGNNRFDIAAAINETFDWGGPFWGCPQTLNIPHLTPRKPDRANMPYAEHRRADRETGITAQSGWKLYTTGSVGSQSLLGVARLAQVLEKYGDHCHVWPFDGPVPNKPKIVLAEIYPSIFDAPSDADYQAQFADQLYHIPDACQVRRTATAILRDTTQYPPEFYRDPQIREEGWIYTIPYLSQTTSPKNI